jgi:hypothetical protein
MATRFNAITNPSLQTFTENLTDIRTLGSSGLQGLMAPNMETVAAREAQLKKYLGSTDYDTQLEESKDLAKLQIALSLMKRGFAAAGATPVRGESAASTLSRELLSPVAGDITPIASGLLQQRRAAEAAKRQEERQLRLAALQDVKDEDKARRALALALTPKPTATTTGLHETIRYVLEQDTDGKWKYSTPEGGQGRVQVRQPKAGGPFYNIQSQKPVSLKPNQIAVLPGNVKSYFPEGETGDETLAAAQYHLRDSLGDIYTITGDNGETRTPMYKSGSKRGTLVEIGTGIVFEKEDLIRQGLSPVKVFAPSKETAPKGVKDPKFEASFLGMMTHVANVQRTRGLGTRGIRFNPYKFSKNPDLFPGNNFPFEKVVGEKDGKIVTENLTKREQGTYANNLRASYLNVFDSIKTGTQPANLNQTFIAGQLSKSLEDLGLKKVGALPLGVTLGKEQITNPVAVTAAYKAAVPGFARNVQETLDRLPFPASDKNRRSGTGRLVLYNEIGVPFGLQTVNPDPIPVGAGAERVGSRASEIRALSPKDIQIRVLAEKAANETGLGATLRASVADSRDKQLSVVGGALDAKTKQLRESLSKRGSAESLEVLDKSLETLARLQRLDADMKRSGITGFARGPFEGVLQKYLGIDLGEHFRSAEGSKAAARFLQQLPITEQLFARDILRTAGEQRYTNKDLDGAQSTLVKLNQSGGFNAGTLRELTGYLKSLVKSGFNAAGTFEIPAATLEKAAMLGVDLKSITPKNNYYSPYFKQGTYAVTKQPIPSYSKQYMDGLRDDGIFGYAKFGGTTGGSTVYKLIVIDDNGIPVPIDSKDRSKGFRTRAVPVVPGRDWKTSVPKAMLDYNRNYLLKTYALDR